MMNSECKRHYYDRWKWRKLVKRNEKEKDIFREVKEKKNALEIEGQAVQKKYFHLKNYFSLKQNLNKTYSESNK